MNNAKLQKTDDHSIFELLPFNRDVEKIRKLERSMRTHGYIPAYPLHVMRMPGTGKLRIKAGHHRFYVARKLGIAVYYVVCEDQATVFELEGSTNPWRPRDYLAGHIREGKHSYIVVGKYHERTGIPLNQSIAMLSGYSASASARLESFKKGTFELGDPTHATLVEDVVTFCKGVGIKWGANSLLVKALSKILFVDVLDVTRLKKKIKAFRTLLEKQPSVIQYITMLDTIYNRQVPEREKIPLEFLANQAAKERSPIKSGC